MKLQKQWLHSDKMSVSCAVLARMIIGPFKKEKEIENGSGSGECYYER